MYLLLILIVCVIGIGGGIAYKNHIKLSPSQRCMACIHLQRSNAKYGSKLQYCAERHEPIIFSPYSCSLYQKRDR